MTPVRSVRPIRVLVASRDSRFLNLARFVLSRNGFLVERTRKLSGLSQFVERRWPEVLVIDASDSRARVVRTAEIVQQAEPCLALVLVAEEAEDSFPGDPTILEKWSLPTLVAEIENAYIRAGRRETHVLAARETETSVPTH